MDSLLIFIIYGNAHLVGYSSNLAIAQYSDFIILTFKRLIWTQAHHFNAQFPGISLNNLHALYCRWDFKNVKISNMIKVVFFSKILCVFVILL